MGCSWSKEVPDSPPAAEPPIMSMQEMNWRMVELHQMSFLNSWDLLVLGAFLVMEIGRLMNDGLV